MIILTLLSDSNVVVVYVIGYTGRSGISVNFCELPSVHGTLCLDRTKWMATIHIPHLPGSPGKVPETKQFWSFVTDITSQGEAGVS
jgi:hypothetical protein